MQLADGQRGSLESDPDPASNAGEVSDPRMPEPSVDEQLPPALADFERDPGPVVSTETRLFVVVDLTLALNPANQPLARASQDQRYYAQRREYFKRHEAGLERDITRWVGSTWIRGTVLMDNQIRNSEANDWILDGFTAPIGTAKARPVRDREYAQFYSQFLSGMPYGFVEG